MKACAERELRLHALIDDELDAANVLEMESHLKSCPGCAEELHDLEALRKRLRTSDLRLSAPPSLRLKIEEALAPGPAAAVPVRALAPRKASRSWLVPSVFAAVAASLVFLIGTSQLASRNLQDQLISSHVRSLLANHLTDVTTTDQHVVKPWFNGRIDFAPPVMDLVEQGYPLVGGRLDYIDGRVVPALVYQRRLHTINLFIRPLPALSSPLDVTARRNGYSLVRWTGDGLEFWAVSDIDLGDLQVFQRDLSKRTTR
jgi:anti-sigma factor RsiW